MSNVRYSLKGLSLLVFMFALASLAHAQATRTWVSGVGDDVNPCSRTAPCKTFAGAISKTADKGEIDALDPAGYGTITITKNITLDGTGTNASILNSGGINGVTVNDSATATPNTVIVNLRNLSINGAGSGLNGINFVAGKALHVQNVVVVGQKTAGGHGLKFEPTAAGVVFNFTVKDSIFRDCASDGIRVNTTSATINGTVDSTVLDGNTNGLEVAGGTVSISRSVVDHNSSSGMVVSNGAFLNADDNYVNNNGTGITNNSSNCRISNNHVHRNTTGLGGTGTDQTFGDNKVIGNTTDVAATVTLSSVAGTNLK